MTRRKKNKKIRYFPRDADELLLWCYEDVSDITFPYGEPSFVEAPVAQQIAATPIEQTPVSAIVHNRSPIIQKETVDNSLSCGTSDCEDSLWNALDFHMFLKKCGDSNTEDVCVIQDDEELLYNQDSKLLSPSKSVSSKDTQEDLLNRASPPNYFQLHMDNWNVLEI